MEPRHCSYTVRIAQHTNVKLISHRMAYPILCVFMNTIHFLPFSKYWNFKFLPKRTEEMYWAENIPDIAINAS